MLSKACISSNQSCSISTISHDCLNEDQILKITRPILTVCQKKKAINIQQITVP